MTPVTGFLLAFVLTVVLTAALIRPAHRWHLVAIPDAQRRHVGTVPVIGGLAMGGAYLATALIAVPNNTPRPVAALLAAVLITIIGGTLDDRHDLAAPKKFLVQIAAAGVIVTWGNTLLSNVGNLLDNSPFTLGRYALVLTVLAIVGVMNAINMIDGLDGLAGGLALVGLAGFGVVAAGTGHATLYLLICLAGGAVAGFLLFNAPWPGRQGNQELRVFMGETGSTLLGLLLAWFAITLAISAAPPFRPVTAVWILALPIGDTVTLMLRRLVRGHSPFRRDREHLHHILLALGLGRGQTVAVMVAAALALAGMALVAERLRVPESVLFNVYLTGLAVYAIVAEVLCRRLKLREKRS